MVAFEGRPNTMKPSTRIGAAASRLVPLLLLASPVASAELIEIAWTPAGGFARTVSVAPGKFVEICGALERGQSVRWTFRADRPLDFNVHYHIGKDVVYPARHDASRAAQGTLSVTENREHCWMWSSTQPAPVRLDVSIAR
jgi:hypothetical protein